MKLHREATDRRSVRLPNRAVAPASRLSLRQRPAGQRRPAIRQGRLCDDRSHRSRRRPGPGRRSGRSAQGTPPFGLTLRAMNFGKRRPSAPSAGRLVSLLVSVIALALALFAVPAQAEECTSSSCVQYNPSLPKAEGEHTPTHHKTPATASKTDGGGGTSPANPGTGGSDDVESEEGESSKEGGVPAGGNDPGQGKPGGSANPGEAKSAPKSETSAGTPASHTDDGGSSPLVPILIAIAVLAAASVAFVMIRQRRQRDGGGPSSTATPEAN